MSPFSPSSVLRLQALALTVILGVGLVAASGRTTRSLVAHPDGSRVAFVFADHAASPLVAPAPSPKPSPHPAAKAHAKRPKAKRKAVARKRWVPAGTGMWTYQWGQTEGGSARRIVRRARLVGLTHLFVRTGTRQGGFDGAPMLRQLLPATKGTKIKVIAWDFPQLANPVADAKRLARAAWYWLPGQPRVAAVAPDIETGSEGTRLSATNVATYLKALRHYLPSDVSIIGVTPWPSEHRAGKYPYGVVAKYSDAIAPMAYWVNRDPGIVAKQTMQRLRVFRKPILPIGQAYDPRIDLPSLRIGPPSRSQVARFLTVARRYGARSASLWVWQFASLDHWKALQSARRLFPAPHLT